MNRIFTTHAGSLPRPGPLVGLFAAKFAGEGVDEAALASAIDAAVDETIARQLEAGVDVINNGEMPRESFFTYVQHRMTGFGGRSHRPIMQDLIRHPGYLERVARATTAAVGNVSLLQPPAAIGAVEYRDSGPIEFECRQLAAALARAGHPRDQAFVSSPSPGIVAAAMQNRHYDRLEDYVAALGRALAVEYRAILEAGFILQIDAPDLAMERHTLFQDKSLAEFLGFVRTVASAINAATAGLDRERVRLHVCWGNYEGPHDCDVALADIWPGIAEVQCGGLMLSMANPRHEHEYRLFREPILPPNATLVAGVIDTTTNYVEHPEAVAGRLERIAEALGSVERIMAGTDCGFETSAGFSSVAADVVWAKLAALTGGARLASERLY
jgi:5-methyltetrahydropteroyltriglutamate--homocysteine methyltransferase